MAKGTTKEKVAEFPIEDYYKNFIFTTDGQIWVGYRLPRKYNPLNDLEFFKSYTSEGEGFLGHDKLDYHFMNIPEKFEIRQHLNKIKKDYVKGEFAEIGDFYFDRSADILEEEVQKNKYFTYVFIKLTSQIQPADPQETFNLLKNEIRQFIKKMVSGDKSTEVLLSYYIKQEKQLFDDLLNYKRVERITENEVERITYYQYHRHHQFIPNLINEMSMNEGIVTGKDGYLTVEHLESTTYSALIPLVKMPPSLYGSAFIQQLQDSLPFPLETHIRIRFNHPKRDKRLVRKKRRLLFHQDENQSNVDAILDDDEVILFGQERLNDLQNDLKKQEKRLCAFTIFFVISAGNKQQLENRIKQLEFALDSTEYEVYRPMVDHLTLFNQALIGSKYSFRSYEQLATTGYVSDLGIELNRNVGNEYGMPLGRAITGKKFTTVHQAIQNSSNLVFYYPLLTKRGIKGALHVNGHTLITGPSGTGKSMLVKLIFMWLAFFDQKVLYIEPKNEMELFFGKAVEKFADNEHLRPFKQLFNKINFISLSDDEKYRGTLDPLLFLKGEVAEITARSVLEGFSEIHKDSSTSSHKKTIISKCVSEVMRGVTPKNLLRVVDLITKKDKDLGDMIKTYNIGLGKVLLGNDHSVPIDFKGKINVLGTQGLKLPSEKEIELDNLTIEQQSSNIIMQVIMKLVYVFSTDKTEDAVVIYDEVGALEKTQQGAVMIDESLRVGRANETDIILLTQALIDYSTDDKKELISYKFAFKPKTIDARIEVLDFFEMANNSRNMEMLDSLVQGTCLMQDHLGRNELIAIDTMFEEWGVALSSTSKDDKHIQQALINEEEVGL